MLPRNFPSPLKPVGFFGWEDRPCLTTTWKFRIGSGGQADEGGSYILVATQQQYTITIIIIMMDDDDGDDIIIT